MRAFKHQSLKVLCLLILSWAIGVSSLLAVKSASIVICAETGEVFHAANPDVVTHPASLTKMMTLYLTFMALREGKLTLQDKISVSKHASRQAPSKLWLKPGTTITIKQAILALVTKSANDAAVALAEALGGGSETYFASKMTQQARRMGMTRTIFKNASGLPNKHQVTTARDMAILSRALYKHFPEYFAFFKEEKFVYKGQVHTNHNHLLGKIKGVDGIKTGFTCASGFNLAASMKRDGRRIIAVVLGGASGEARDKKMVKLLETTYDSLSGKKAPLNKNYASISDLIHALGPTEANAFPIKTVRDKRIKAKSPTEKAKKIEAKFNSVEALLLSLEESPPKLKKNNNLSSPKNLKKRKNPLSTKIIKISSKKGTEYKNIKQKRTGKSKKKIAVSRR